jgi:hypothetical protein
MMRKGLNQVSFSHILREGNSVAGFNILKLCIDPFASSFILLVFFLKIF